MCQLRHIALYFCICRLKTWQPEKPVYLIIDFSAYIFETRLSKVALEMFPVNVEFPILFLRYLSLVYLGFSYSSIL